MQNNNNDILLNLGANLSINLNINLSINLGLECYSNDKLKS